MNKIVKEDIDNLVQSEEFNCEIFRNKTILVTGINGLIAKYFTYYLLVLNNEKNLNMKVVGLVRNLDKLKQNFEDFLEYDNFDIINQDVCDPINYDGNIDYIFHAASSASATAIKNNPVGIIKANTIGTINVLNLAKDKKSLKVIFPSTREVYGDVGNIESIKENNMGIIDPMVSRNSYPESKRLAESLFVAYNNQYNVPFNILRIAHTYGPTMEINNDGRVMSDFVSNVVNNRDIVLNSDGTAIRSFCYITDTIRGILYVLTKGKDNEVYNLSNETEPYMIRDVASTLINLYPEKNINLQFANVNHSILNNSYVSYKIVGMNNEKLNMLGWNPKVKLSDGLKRTVDSFDVENNLQKVIRK